MSQLSNIITDAANNAEIRFISGSAIEVENKVASLHQQQDKSIYPCVLWFDEDDEYEGEFVNVVDSLTFLVCGLTTPPNLFEHNVEIYDRLEEKRQAIIQQFAKDSRVAGVSVKKFPNNGDRKKFIIGSDYVLAIEVVIKDFTFKKYCI